MNIKVMKNAKYFAMVSALVILAGVVMLLTTGFNFGIDFTGGTVVTIEVGDGFELDVVKDATKEYATTDYSVAISEGTKAEIKIQDKDVDPEEQNEVRKNILSRIQETYPDAVVESIDRVGATAGSELLFKTVMSILIACGGVLVYIWIRFELLSGFAALVALIHDALIMCAMVLIFRTRINSSFIAAVLTIVGYSINDTIVVFDRIREYSKRYKHSLNREKIVDKSVSDTIVRSLNTSITTLFTVTALYIFGVQAIKEFALPLMVGILSGTYSSIFIASPLWVALHNLEKKMKESKAAKRKKKA